MSTSCNISHAQASNISAIRANWFKGDQLHLSTMSAATCKNCENPIPEPGKFCPMCGQSVKEFSRPWLEAARELASELFDIDGRMLIFLPILGAAIEAVSHPNSPPGS
jgi:RNA polymerase subunit RPABC4/transcription elongation factor Spt4